MSIEVLNNHGTTTTRSAPPTTKTTGCGEEVDLGPLRYLNGSHLDLQQRLTAMLDLVLQGVPAAEATQIVDAEHARGYV